MSIQLFRIDERLIHGQVVMGWGRQLRPARYVVVDDALAESDWEQDLYRLTVDGSTEALFVHVVEAREQLSDWLGDRVRTILLTRSPLEMARLARGGLLEGREVNVGGLHHRPGRTEVRPYIHLDPEDRTALRSLAREGAVLSGQDLPDAPRVSQDDLLG